MTKILLILVILPILHILVPDASRGSGARQDGHDDGASGQVVPVVQVVFGKLARPPSPPEKKLRWAGLLNKLGQMSALVSRQWMSGAGMIACDGSACTDKHGTLQVL